MPAIGINLKNGYVQPMALNEQELFYKSKF